MRVRVAVLGEVHPAVPRAILSGLPACFGGGEVVAVGASLAPCYDRTLAQFDAECVLGRVPAPEPGWIVLGLVSVDLFLPALAYVFGLSPVGQRRALLSSARLHDGPDAPGSLDVVIRRTVTEAVHELGHAAGLIHCVVSNCAMHRSLWPEAVDLKLPEYCPVCAAQIEARISA